MEVRDEELLKRKGEVAELRSLVRRYTELTRVQKALLTELNKPFFERREKVIKELKAKVNQYREYGGVL